MKEIKNNILSNSKNYLLEKGMVIVIPIHNEKEVLQKFLEQVQEENKEYPVLLVFDRCSDNSMEIAVNFLEKQENHTFFAIDLQENNKGKSGACFYGLQVLKECFPNGNPAVLFWDSDLEYQMDKALLHRLFSFIKEKKGMACAKRSGKWLLRSKLANHAVKIVLSIASRRENLPKDILSAVHGMPLYSLLLALENSNGFDMEARIVRHSMDTGIPIYEDNVIYKPRKKGKKIKFYHLWQICFSAMLA